MKTQFNPLFNFAVVLSNGRFVTVDNGMLSLTDENGDAFDFGYVGHVGVQDIEDFLWSVDNENDDSAWARGLDEDRDKNNSAIFQA